jgi:hypothetical protein
MDPYQFLWLIFAIVWLLAALKSKPAVRRQTNASRFMQGAAIILGFLLLLQPLPRQVLAIRFVPSCAFMMSAQDAAAS